MVRKLAAILGLLLLVFPSPVLGQTTNTITLNPAVTFQIMTGWEATSQAMQPGQAEPGSVAPNWSVFKDYLMDQAVNDLGINRLRVEVKSGVENSTDYAAQSAASQINAAQWRCLRYSTVNDDTDPLSVAKNANQLTWPGFHFTELDSKMENLVLPLKQKTEARGEKLFINLEYVAFTAQITGTGCDPTLKYIHTNLNTAGYPDEYAEFILATSLHLKNKYGLIPDAWEVILEPDNTTQWTGTMIGKAIKAAGDLLSANGFPNPKFIAPSTTNMNNASVWFDQIKAVSGALQYVSEISYHRYGGVSDTALQNIATRATQNNKNTSMIEWIGADYNTLHKDLTMGRNSAWQQFTLAFGSTGTPADTGGNYYNLFLSQTTPQQIVQMGSRTKFLRQYFKYIRPGAERIDATTTNSAFDPVAFINQNGKYVTVVKATTGGSFSINNLPAGTYGIFYTTNAAYDVNLADQTITSGQSLSTSIPAAGVITIYNKSVAATPNPTSVPTGSSKVGDIVINNKVDIFDYNALLTDFGKKNDSLTPADLDDDNDVDIFDYNLLLTNFGL